MSSVFLCRQFGYNRLSFSIKLSETVRIKNKNQILIWHYQYAIEDDVSMKNLNKKCILEDNKFCNDCQDCMFCDLNPEKLCNNCAACINNDADYQSIIIDDILTLEEGLSKRKA